MPDKVNLDSPRNVVPDQGEYVFEAADMVSGKTFTFHILKTHDPEILKVGSVLQKRLFYSSLKQVAGDKGIASLPNKTAIVIEGTKLLEQSKEKRMSGGGAFVASDELRELKEGKRKLPGYLIHEKDKTLTYKEVLKRSKELLHSYTDSELTANFKKDLASQHAVCALDKALDPSRLAAYLIKTHKDRDSLGVVGNYLKGKYDPPHFDRQICDQFFGESHPNPFLMAEGKEITWDEIKLGIGLSFSDKKNQTLDQILNDLGVPPSAFRRFADAYTYAKRYYDACHKSDQVKTFVDGEVFQQAAQKLYDKLDEQRERKETLEGIVKHLEGKKLHKTKEEIAKMSSEERTEYYAELKEHPMRKLEETQKVIERAEKADYRIETELEKVGFHYAVKGEPAISDDARMEENFTPWQFAADIHEISVQRFAEPERGNAVVRIFKALFEFLSSPFVLLYSSLFDPETHETAASVGRFEHDKRGYIGHRTLLAQVRFAQRLFEKESDQECKKMAATLDAAYEVGSRLEEAHRLGLKSKKKAAQAYAQQKYEKAERFLIVPFGQGEGKEYQCHVLIFDKVEKQVRHLFLDGPFNTSGRVQAVKYYNLTDPTSIHDFIGILIEQLPYEGKAEARQEKGPTVQDRSLEPILLGCKLVTAAKNTPADANSPTPKTSRDPLKLLFLTLDQVKLQVKAEAPQRSLEDATERYKALTEKVSRLSLADDTKRAELISHYSRMTRSKGAFYRTYVNGLVSFLEEHQRDLSRTERVQVLAGIKFYAEQTQHALERELDIGEAASLTESFTRFIDAKVEAITADEKKEKETKSRLNDERVIPFEGNIKNPMQQKVMKVTPEQELSEILGERVPPAMMKRVITIGQKFQEATTFEKRQEVLERVHISLEEIESLLPKQPLAAKTLAFALLRAIPPAVAPSAAVKIFWDHIRSIDLKKHDEILQLREESEAWTKALIRLGKAAWSGALRSAETPEELHLSPTEVTEYQVILPMTIRNLFLMRSWTYKDKFEETLSKITVNSDDAKRLDKLRTDFFIPKREAFLEKEVRARMKKEFAKEEKPLATYKKEKTKFDSTYKKQHETRHKEWEEDILKWEEASEACYEAWTKWAPTYRKWRVPLLESVKKGEKLEELAHTPPKPGDLKLRYTYDLDHYKLRRWQQQVRECALQIEEPEFPVQPEFVFVSDWMQISQQGDAWVRDSKKLLESRPQLKESPGCEQLKGKFSEWANHYIEWQRGKVPDKPIRPVEQENFTDDERRAWKMWTTACEKWTVGIEIRLEYNLLSSIDLDERQASLFEVGIGKWQQDVRDYLRGKKRTIPELPRLKVFGDDYWKKEWIQWAEGCEAWKKQIEKLMKEDPLQLSDRTLSDGAPRAALFQWKKEFAKWALSVNRGKEPVFPKTPERLGKDDCKVYQGWVTACQTWQKEVLDRTQNKPEMPDKLDQVWRLERDYAGSIDEGTFFAPPLNSRPWEPRLWTGFEPDKPDAVNQYLGATKETVQTEAWSAFAEQYGAKAAETEAKKHIQAYENKTKTALAPEEKQPFIDQCIKRREKYELLLRFFKVPLQEVVSESDIDQAVEKVILEIQAYLKQQDRINKASSEIKELHSYLKNRYGNPKDVETLDQTLKALESFKPYLQEKYKTSAKIKEAIEGIRKLAESGEESHSNNNNLNPYAEDFEKLQSCLKKKGAIQLAIQLLQDSKYTSTFRSHLSENKSFENTSARETIKKSPYQGFLDFIEHFRDGKPMSVDTSAFLKVPELEKGEIRTDTTKIDAEYNLQKLEKVKELQQMARSYVDIFNKRLAYYGVSSVNDLKEFESFTQVNEQEIKRKREVLIQEEVKKEQAADVYLNQLKTYDVTTLEDTWWGGWEGESSDMLVVMGRFLKELGINKEELTYNLLDKTMRRLSIVESADQLFLLNDQSILTDAEMQMRLLSCHRFHSSMEIVKKEGSTLFDPKDVERVLIGFDERGDGVQYNPHVFFTMWGLKTDLTWEVKKRIHGIVDEKEPYTYLIPKELGYLKQIEAMGKILENPGPQVLDHAHCNRVNKPVATQFERGARAVIGKLSDGAITTEEVCKDFHKMSAAHLVFGQAGMGGEHTYVISEDPEKPNGKYRIKKAAMARSSTEKRSAYYNTETDLVEELVEVGKETKIPHDVHMHSFLYANKRKFATPALEAFLRLLGIQESAEGEQQTSKLSAKALVECLNFAYHHTESTSEDDAQSFIYQRAAAQFVAFKCLIYDRGFFYDENNSAWFKELIAKLPVQADSDASQLFYMLLFEEIRQMANAIAKNTPMLFRNEKVEKWKDALSVLAKEADSYDKSAAKREAKKISKALPAYNFDKFISYFTKHKDTNEQKQFAYFLLWHYQSHPPKDDNEWSLLLEAWSILKRARKDVGHNLVLDRIQTEMQTTFLPGITEYLADKSRRCSFLNSLSGKDIEEWHLDPQKTYCYFGKDNAGKSHTIDLRLGKGFDGVEIKFSHLGDLPQEFDQNPLFCRVFGKGYKAVAEQLQDSQEDKTTYTWTDEESGLEFEIAYHHDLEELQIFQWHHGKKYSYQNPTFSKYSSQIRELLSGKPRSKRLEMMVAERGVWVLVKGGGLDTTRTLLAAGGTLRVEDEVKKDEEKAKSLREKNFLDITSGAICLNISGTRIKEVSFGEGENKKYLCTGLKSTYPLLPFRSGHDLLFLTSDKKHVDEIRFPEGFVLARDQQKREKWVLKGEEEWEWVLSGETDMIANRFGSDWRSYVLPLKNQSTGEMRYWVYPWDTHSMRKRGAAISHLQSPADFMVAYGPQFIADKAILQFITGILAMAENAGADMAKLWNAAQSALGEYMDHGTIVNPQNIIGTVQEAVKDHVPQDNLDDLFKMLQGHSKGKQSSDVDNEPSDEQGFGLVLKWLKVSVLSIIRPTPIQFYFSGKTEKSTHAGFLYMAHNALLRRDWAGAVSYVDKMVKDGFSNKGQFEQLHLMVFKLFITDLIGKFPALPLQDFAKLFGKMHNLSDAKEVLTFFKDSKEFGGFSKKELAFYLKLLLSLERVSKQQVADFSLLGGVKDVLAFVLGVEYAETIAKDKAFLQDSHLMLTPEERLTLFDMTGGLEGPLGAFLKEQGNHLTSALFGNPQERGVVPSAVELDIPTENEIEEMIRAMTLYSNPKKYPSIEHLHKSVGSYPKPETVLANFNDYIWWIYTNKVSETELSFLFRSVYHDRKISEWSNGVDLEKAADTGRRLIALFYHHKKTQDKENKLPLLNEEKTLFDKLQSLREQLPNLPKGGEKLERLAKEFADAIQPGDSKTKQRVKWGWGLLRVAAFGLFLEVQKAKLKESEPKENEGGSLTAEGVGTSFTRHQEQFLNLLNGGKYTSFAQEIKQQRAQSKVLSPSFPVPAEKESEESNKIPEEQLPESVKQNAVDQVDLNNNNNAVSQPQIAEEEVGLKEQVWQELQKKIQNGHFQIISPLFENKVFKQVFFSMLDQEDADLAIDGALKILDRVLSGVGKFASVLPSGMNEQMGEVSSLFSGPVKVIQSTVKTHLSVLLKEAHANYEKLLPEQELKARKKRVQVTPRTWVKVPIELAKIKPQEWCTYFSTVDKGKIGLNTKRDKAAFDRAKDNDPIEKRVNQSIQKGIEDTEGDIKGKLNASLQVGNKNLTNLEGKVKGRLEELQDEVEGKRTNIMEKARLYAKPLGIQNLIFHSGKRDHSDIFEALINLYRDGKLGGLGSFALPTHLEAAAREGLLDQESLAGLKNQLNLYVLHQLFAAQKFDEMAVVIKGVQDDPSKPHLKTLKEVLGKNPLPHARVIGNLLAKVRPDFGLAFSDIERLKGDVEIKLNELRKQAETFQEKIKPLEKLLHELKNMTVHGQFEGDITQFLLAATEQQQLTKAAHLLKEMRTMAMVTFDKLPETVKCQTISTIYSKLQERLDNSDVWRSKSSDLRRLLQEGTERNRYASLEDGKYILDQPDIAHKCLVFDYRKGFITRIRTKKGIENMIGRNKEGKAILFDQIIMGTGKSTQLFPEASRLLVEMGYKVVSMTTEPLIGQFTSFMDERAFTFNFDMQFGIQKNAAHHQIVQHLTNLVSTLHALKDEGRYTLTTPQRLAWLRNKRVQLQDALYRSKGSREDRLEIFEKLQLVKEIEAYFKSEDLVCLYDEDVTRDISFEYNVANDSHRPANQIRFDIAEKLTYLMLINDEMCKQVIDDGLRNHLDPSPLLRTLASQLFDDTEFWKSVGWKETAWAKVNKEQFIDYVMGVREDSPSGMGEWENKTHFHYVSTLKKYLSRTFSSIYRIHPKLDRGVRKDNGFTVVPYEDGEEKENIQYGEETEIIWHTLLHHAQGRVGLRAFSKLFTQLEKKNNPEKADHCPLKPLASLVRGADEELVEWAEKIKTWRDWTHAVRGIAVKLPYYVVFSDLESIKRATPKETVRARQKMALLKTLLCGYIMNQLEGEYVKIYDEQIICNSQDVPVNEVRGASGTGDRQALNALNPADGVNLSSDYITGEIVHRLDLDQEFELFDDPLEYAQKQAEKPNCAAIINRGYEIEKNNTEAFVRKLRESPEVLKRQIVFRDSRTHKPRIWQPGRNGNLVEYAPTSIDPKTVLFVYNTQDSRGVDFPIPTEKDPTKEKGKDTFVAVLLDMGTNLEDAEQALLRARQLGPFGQRGVIAGNHKMANFIRQVHNERAPDNEQLSEDAPLTIGQALNATKAKLMEDNKIRHIKAAIFEQKTFRKKPLDQVVSQPFDLNGVTDPTLLMKIDECAFAVARPLYITQNTIDHEAEFLPEKMTDQIAFLQKLAKTELEITLSGWTVWRQKLKENLPSSHPFWQLLPQLLPPNWESDVTFWNRMQPILSAWQSDKNFSLTQQDLQLLAFTVLDPVTTKEKIERVIQNYQIIQMPILIMKQLTGETGGQVSSGELRELFIRLIGMEKAFHSAYFGLVESCADFNKIANHKTDSNNNNNNTLDETCANKKAFYAAYLPPTIPSGSTGAQNQQQQVQQQVQMLQEVKQEEQEETETKLLRGGRDQKCDALNLKEFLNGDNSSKTYSRVLNFPDLYISNSAAALSEQFAMGRSQCALRLLVVQEGQTFRSVLVAETDDEHNKGNFWTLRHEEDTTRVAVYPLTTSRFSHVPVYERGGAKPNLEIEGFRKHMVEAKLYLGFKDFKLEERLLLHAKLHTMKRGTLEWHQFTWGCAEGNADYATFLEEEYRKGAIHQEVLKQIKFGNDEQKALFNKYFFKLTDELFKQPEPSYQEIREAYAMVFSSLKTESFVRDWQGVFDSRDQAIQFTSLYNVAIKQTLAFKLMQQTKLNIFCMALIVCGKALKKEDKSGDHTPTRTELEKIFEGLPQTDKKTPPEQLANERRKECIDICENMINDKIEALRQVQHKVNYQTL